jgi:uncharacterized protein YdeI (YjbR/CyaY-like superfamily)
MRFEATIEKRGSGHLLEIPFDVKAKWGKARAPVAATINERTVEVPPELRAVFAREPGLRAFFESLSFTHRKEYVRWIENPKRDKTRRARATKAVEMLRKGVKTPG